MAGTNNNFKHLQDFEISPPTGLFAKLWKKIKRTGKEIQNVEPANEEVRQNPDISGSKYFSDLQSFISPDIEPPSFNFEKIKDAVSLHKNDTENAPVKTVNSTQFKYKLLAAAAITGFVFLTYFLTGNGFLSSKSKNTQSATNDSRFDSTMQSNKNAGISSTNTGNNNLHTKNPLQHTPIIYANYYISKNGNSTINENDFIYTLTSFTYDESISFLKKLKKDKLISLNSYSYLNVSDKIAVFLKEMYEVNDKGKPTRKAKRLKQKLAKWKKKDESYFDRNPQKNPLDIIDLSEFILK